jgi:hypothetical protein
MRFACVPLRDALCVPPRDALSVPLRDAPVLQMFVRALPPGAVSACAESAAARYVRPVSSEAAEFPAVTATAPLAAPVLKMDALALSSGEAQVWLRILLPPR